VRVAPVHGIFVCSEAFAASFHAPFVDLPCLDIVIVINSPVGIPNAHEYPKSDSIPRLIKSILSRTEETFIFLNSWSLFLKCVI